MLRHPRADRALTRALATSLAFVGALTCVTAAGPPAYAGVATKKGHVKGQVRFARIVDDTARVVLLQTNQKVRTSVSLREAATGKPARGRVWFVDKAGRQVSRGVSLNAAGAATVTRDPDLSNTAPGKHVYRIRYGGNAGLEAKTSGAASTFTAQSVPGPAMTTPVTTFVAAPDFLNADVADLRGVTGWSEDGPNSVNQNVADSIDAVLAQFASHNPDAFLIPGDLVNGHWGNPVNTTGVFGNTATATNQADMARRQASVYHGYLAAALKRAGLHSRTYAAVGDHDVGDNPWGDAAKLNPGGTYNRFKRDHLPIWRNAFADAYTTKADGTYRFPGHAQALRGTPWERTAYAVRKNDTLFVTLDEFARRPDGTTVDVTVSGRQLRWLESVLAGARRDGVRWIVVQGHAPILPARIGSSTGLYVRGREKSALWQLMKKYKVNVYVAGEVHATSRVTRDGITQIVTGRPMPTSGRMTYLHGTTYPNKMVLTIYAYGTDYSTGRTQTVTVDQQLWQGGYLAGDTSPDVINTFKSIPGKWRYVGASPRVRGTLTVHIGNTAGPGNDALQPFDTTETKADRPADYV